jgi:hypothetical protein
LDAKEDEWAALEALPSERRRIDVWWWGDATSRLMLLMAYLMTRSDIWREAKIRVLATGYEDVSEETIRDLGKTLDEVRIEAEPEIVAKGNGDAIAGYSADSAIVFLPFRLRGDQLMDPFGGPLQDLLPRLPIVALGLAAEDIDLDAEPEEGKAGEIAAAHDALSDAEKKAKDAEKEATEAGEEADQTNREMQDAATSGADEATITKLEAANKEAKEKAGKAARRAAKATAKAEDAARVVEALGATPHDMDKEPSLS